MPEQQQKKPAEKQLDVYRDWLKIEETARPLNHYQLLRVKQFEDDPAKIRANYRQLNAHVRKFASGNYAQQSQDLLNELAKAMLCLTDSRRKSEYDTSLGRGGTGEQKRRTFEEILLGRKLLDSAQLDKARNLAKAIGVDLRDAVMQQKLAAPDAVMQAHAESLGLPYVELSDLTIDESLIPKVPATLARQHSCAPILIDEGQLLLASPNLIAADVEENLRMRFGMPIRMVICTPTGMNEVIGKHYSREAAAAEMAAAGASTSTAPGAGKKKAQRDPGEIAAARKKHQQITLFVFNFFLMGFFGLASAMGWAVNWGTPLSLLYGAILGAVVGGGTYIFLRNRA
jgi:hypothetical protein